MSDATSGVLGNIHWALENTQKLDTTLQRIMRSLEKRGIQVTTNLDDLIGDIQQALLQAQHEGENLMKQLEQLQNLVQRSALVTSSLQLEQVLDQVVSSVLMLTGAERAFLMLLDRETGELIPRFARNWDSSVPPEDVAFSRSVVSTALERVEPIVTTNAQDDMRFQNAESVVTQGLRSILCIPLILDAQIVGVLYADNRIRQGIFTQNILPLLGAFSTQAAIAIEKARLHEEEVQKQRLEKELSVGQRIQLSLLPKMLPAIPGWEFAASYRAARIVGGDFYDFFELPDGQLGIAIGDVADKGVPAAIFMALSRTMIRTSAIGAHSPSAALLEANALIQRNSDSDLFLTAFYATLNPENGRVVFTNAGHNHPLLLRQETGQFERLRARGIVLGLFDGIKLEENDCQVDPGDVLIFYTDGLTEAMNHNYDEFGEERLCATLAAQQGATSDQILQALLEAVEAFTEGAPQSDDLTIVIIRRTG